MSAAESTATNSRAPSNAGVSSGSTTRPRKRTGETPWSCAALVHEGDKLPTARITAMAATGKNRNPNTKATVKRLRVSQSNWAGACVDARTTPMAASAGGKANSNKSSATTNKRSRIRPPVARAKTSANPVAIAPAPRILTPHPGEFRRLIGDHNAQLA